LEHRGEALRLWHYIQAGLVAAMHSGGRRHWMPACSDMEV